MPLSSATTTTVDAGLRAIAARLIELAQAHGMSPNQNANLPALLAALKIEDPIPLPAFAVVTEILFAILSADPPPRAPHEEPPS